MEKKEPKYIRGKYTKAAKEATKRYQAKAYDEIKFRVHKGEKAKLQELAADNGYSLNSFITEAVERFSEYLEYEEESGDNTAYDNMTFKDKD